MLFYEQQNARIERVNSNDVTGECVIIFIVLQEPHGADFNDPPDEISSNILRINSNLRHHISGYFIVFDIVLISNDLN